MDSNIEMISISRFYLIVICFFSAVCFGGTYKWVDQEGRVNFSDKPPENEPDYKTVTEGKTNIYLTGLFPNLENLDSNVSSYITLVRSSEDLIPFEFYEFQGILHDYAKPTDVVNWKGRIWVAVELGLLEVRSFDDWFLHHNKNGLPGDKAFRVDAKNDALLVGISNYNPNSSAWSVDTGYYYILNTKKWVSANANFIDVLAGRSFTPKNSDLIHATIADVRIIQGKAWVASVGRYTGKDSFSGGGLSVLDPIDGRGLTYNETSGLASSYCVAVDYDKSNNVVWVAHGDYFQGLSYFNLNNNEIKKIRSSLNGVPLKGNEIKVVEGVVFIGSNEGLVIFDPKSGFAMKLDQENSKLPTIVTGIDYSDNSSVVVSLVSFANSQEHRYGLLVLNLDNVKKHLGLINRMQ